MLRNGSGKPIQQATSFWVLGKAVFWPKKRRVVRNERYVKRVVTKILSLKTYQTLKLFFFVTINHVL